MRPSLSRPRLQTLLRSATGKRIAVVGDAMLDVYLKGDVDRISPEAPVPVVRVRERRSALGGAANVAQNVAALGAKAELVAVVGRDASAKALRAMLKEHGGETRALVEVDRPTTTKTRVSRACSRSCASTKKRTPSSALPNVARVLNAVAHAVARADALVLEDYNKGLLVPAVIRAAIDAANARGIPVVVDPKFRNFFAYKGATIFKPNRRELETALGATMDVDHPEDRARHA